MPTPNEDIDAAVLEWIEFVEAVFFDCPPAAGPHAGFLTGFEEIHRLTAEVEALITFEESLRAG